MSFGSGDIAIYRNIHFDINPEYIGDWQLGRQHALYTKRLMLPPLSVMKELNTLFQGPKLFDAWHLKIQSDVPTHKDTVANNTLHYRYNVSNKGSYWFNLNNRTFLLEPNDAVLFRSDISDHGLELFEKKPVEIFSFGIFIERDTS